tara:strand:+ start:452 stop:721 length:270 start_codon:yes stop_codon:yes gene_type:complete
MGRQPFIRQKGWQSDRHCQLFTMTIARNEKEHSFGADRLFHGIAGSEKAAARHAAAAPGNIESPAFRTCRRVIQAGVLRLDYPNPIVPR